MTSDGRFPSLTTLEGFEVAKTEVGNTTAEIMR